MLSINTNLSSLITQRSMKSATSLLNQAVERMSTGYKVNHAKDNAAAYSIITNMDTKISAYQVAEDNCAMGLDMLTTATESLDLIYDKLTRLRDLAEQASNGTYGEQSKKAINSEANALVDEIERIYNNVEYNGINLMKGRVTGSEESKFIKDIDRRDTSKMTTLASVKIDEALTSGTYSISTADELAKLATMTNNGLIGADTEFVLANDIDLQAWCDAHAATGGWVPIGILTVDNIGNVIANQPFTANFDGNGYVISNLNIKRNDECYIGLFGYVVYTGNIKNTGVEELYIKAKSYVGGLVGAIHLGTVTNCYTLGDIESDSTSGGLIGCSKTDISNCYSGVNISGRYQLGGLIGAATDSENNIGAVDSCYTYGNIVSQEYAGGLIGYLGIAVLKNSYSLGSVTISGIVNNDLLGRSYSSDITNCFSLADIALTGVKPFEFKNNAKINILSGNISLQIGTTSNENSKIITDTGYALDGLSILRNIGSGTGDYLGQCDFLLGKLSEKQTELGSVSNRLDSALEEISTQYENLVSSRSTLRDADIAEVSSQYIQQQILQQASATLMATANQAPSIALQLI